MWCPLKDFVISFYRQFFQGNAAQIVSNQPGVDSWTLSIPSKLLDALNTFQTPGRSQYLPNSWTLSIPSKPLDALNTFQTPGRSQYLPNSWTLSIPSKLLDALSTFQTPRRSQYLANSWTLSIPPKPLRLSTTFLSSELEDSVGIFGYNPCHIPS
ncbi:hypothetical protein RRG08_006208 [Elysia crispata]|uniref:Uncharacterized protein n=1 Tax=Elysia crispata TaxID=231223 RepID=A0AAE0Y7V5_9GAST|nr:hypothetical protein RRG08_006208 [Elysia crispata]